MKVLKWVLEGAVTSFVTGATVSLIWLLVLGEQPSLLVLLVASQVGTTAWSLWHAARFRRRWLAVLSSYQRPALGEGIDIPHRPPTAEQ